MKEPIEPAPPQLFTQINQMRVLQAAIKLGYYLERLNEPTRCMILVGIAFEVKVVVYFTQKGFLVTTALDHPVKGKTQMTRPGLDYLQLEKVLADPRAHTDVGYIKKENWRKPKQATKPKPKSQKTWQTKTPTWIVPKQKKTRTS